MTADLASFPKEAPVGSSEAGTEQGLTQEASLQSVGTWDTSCISSLLQGGHQAADLPGQESQLGCG